MKKTIGLKIKTLRKTHKDTLKELAEKVGGYDFSNLSKFERGERKAPIELLLKLCEVYNVNINYFFEDFTDAEGKLIGETKLTLDEIKSKYEFIKQENKEVNISDEEIIEAIKLIRLLKQR